MMYLSAILYTLLHVESSYAVTGTKGDYCGTVANGDCGGMKCLGSTCPDGSSLYGCGMKECYLDESLVCINRRDKEDVCPEKGDYCGTVANGDCSGLMCPETQCPDGSKYGCGIDGACYLQYDSGSTNLVCMNKRDKKDVCPDTDPCSLVRCGVTANSEPQCCGVTSANTAECDVKYCPPQPSATQDKTCPETMIWDDCATVCPPTCESPDVICLACAPGCQCAKGYDIYVKDDNKCITKDECPPEPSTTQDKPDPCSLVKCGVTANSEPQCCGVTSANTAECDVKYCPPQTCPETMQWNDCGSACPPTCDKPVQACIDMCVPGCECAKGYDFYVTDENKCITRDECPPEPSTTQDKTCPKTMEWNDCATVCPPTCESPDVICDACAPGCQCAKGYDIYVKDENKCITKDECPEPINCKTCGTASISDGCNVCTCDPDGSENCSKVNTCVWQGIRECIPDVPTCKDPETMIYKECGTACPAVCGETGPGPKFCTLQCVAECQCKNEVPYYSKSDGKCVAECPKTSCISGEKLVNGECYPINCKTCEQYSDGCNDCKCDESGVAGCTRRACTGLVVNEPQCYSCYDGFTVSNGICIESEPTTTDIDCDIFGFEPDNVEEFVCDICFGSDPNKRLCRAIKVIAGTLVCDFTDFIAEEAKCMLEYCATTNKDLENCDLAAVRFKQGRQKAENCACDMFECDRTYVAQGNGVERVKVFIGFVIVFAIFAWM